MASAKSESETAPVLSDRVFKCFSDFVTGELGIKMPASKRSMLQSRLQKRMRRLHIETFEAYRDYVFSECGKAEELPHLVDVVTTNKTDFFREPKHYDVLVGMVLPDLVESSGAGLRSPFKVWSAGCSTGAEPYTLAIILSEYAARISGFRFSILASDICSQVLEKARSAIYDEREGAPVPSALMHKYFLRSKDRRRPRIRVVPELRKVVEFRRINFMAEDFGLSTKRDIIFCRNVIIYFDRATQEKVLARLCRHLKPGGYLFMGHSETLNGFSLPLQQATTTVYKRI